MPRPIVIAAFCLLLAACAPRVTPLNSPAQVEAADMTSAAQPSPVAAPPLTRSMLQNAAYHSPDWGDSQLANGVFYRPPLNPGESSSAYTTRLLDPVLFGDLNADGIEDAAVILATQNGGTGHFIELAAVLDRGGSLDNVSTVSLGDRVRIEAGRIDGGVIILEMRVHGPYDGLCCPSQFETWRFRLENNVLTRLP